MRVWGPSLFARSALCVLAGWWSSSACSQAALATASDPIEQGIPDAAASDVRGNLPTGYLSTDAVDVLAVLPPPPDKGDPRYAAERRIFRMTRKMQGTPRWELAAQDADIRAADLLRTFACALNVELAPTDVPRLVQAARKATIDSGRAVGTAKLHFGKARPFQIDRGATCRPAAEVGTSSDYPSGHSVAGWTWALVLAEIVPDRATEILARGRAYGDSRVVCGMHNPSAVEAGRLSGSVIMARVAAEPAYRADIEAARQEFAAAVRERPAPDAARCEREAQLIAAPLILRSQ